MPQNPYIDRSEALFNQIYERNYSTLYAYFYGRTIDGDVALDLLQETFTRAWNQIQTLTELPESRQRYWLFAVAKNLFTDSTRRTARWQKIEGDMVSSAKERAKQSNDPMELQNQLVVLEEAIAQLPEQLRIVLSMSAINGMNSKEIGETLGIAPGTIRYQLSVARKELLRTIGSEALPGM